MPAAAVDPRDSAQKDPIHELDLRREEISAAPLESDLSALEPFKGTPRPQLELLEGGRSKNPIGSAGSNGPGLDADLMRRILALVPALSGAKNAPAGSAPEPDCAKEKRGLASSLSQLAKLVSGAAVVLLPVTYKAHDAWGLIINSGIVVLAGFLGTTYGAQLMEKIGKVFKALLA